MRSADDAQYFLAWLARVRESAASHADYNSIQERQQVLQNIDAASAVYEQMLQ